MKNYNFWYFIFITSLLFVAIYLTNFFLNTEELLFSFYSEQLAKNQLEKLLEAQQKWT